MYRKKGICGKKSAAEMHGILVETYIKCALVCRNWLGKFEHEDLEAIANKDPDQTLKELSEKISVTKRAVWKRLHGMEMIQK